MANSIEIFENTLLKLIVRQGANSDRKNITFSSGELAFTTDTNRLYVGDGTTQGGILVGNVFSGSATNITTLAPAKVGDYAFDSDNNKLYVLNSEDGSNISDWTLVGGIYSANDNTISITSNNRISVNKLSSGNISNDAVSNSIEIDGTDRISLSSSITTDQIRPKNTTAVTLFSALSVNGVRYNFPTTSAAGGFLKTTNGTDLEWETTPFSSSNTITVNYPLTSFSGGDTTGTPMNPTTQDIQIGASPTLSCFNLWARYDANTNSIIANKGISSVSRTSAGKYTFTFDNTLSTPFPMAMAQIYGSGAKSHDARVVEVNTNTCDVEIYYLFDPFIFRDVDFSLKIET